MSGTEWAAWIAVAVAVVTIAATIAIAYWQRARKELSFETYTEFPLFAENPLAQQIEISANGQKLQSPHILITTIRNSGNSALRPGDFYGPITIEFNNSQLVALHIEPMSGAISSDFASSAHSISIEPLLLNRREGLVCYALVDGYPDNVSVSARIADGEVYEVPQESISESFLKSMSISIGFGLFGPRIMFSPRNVGESARRKLPTRGTKRR